MSFSCVLVVKGLKAQFLVQVSHPVFDCQCQNVSANPVHHVLRTPFYFTQLFYPYSKVKWCLHIWKVVLETNVLPASSIY